MGAAKALHLELGSDAPSCHGGDGRSVSLGARDAVLLAWLAIEGAAPRARLAALLWPDSSEEQGRNALRQRLFNLKRHCGAELLTGTTHLSLAAAVTHDLGQSTQLLGSLRMPESPAIEAWLEAQRQQRRARWRSQVEQQIERAEAEGDFGTALPLAQSLLEADPLSEDAHRRLMRLHYLRGDRSAALLAFDQCEQLLKHEVGTTPSAATLSLLATIEETHAVEAAGAPASLPQGPLPAAVLRPPQMIGRQSELTTLVQAAQSVPVALVIGEAGMGKSRLLKALQALGGPAPLNLVMVSSRPGDALAPYATLARLAQEILQRLPIDRVDGLRPTLAWLPLTVQPAPGEHSANQAEPCNPAGAALHRWGGGSAGEPPEALAQNMGHLLAQVCPPVTGFVLDDLHFADDASLELLQRLLCTARDADPGLPPGARPDRAFWLLAMRPAAPDTRLHHLIDAVAASVPHCRLHLKPLTIAQMGALLESLSLQVAGGEAMAAALHQRTGGNPLFALETLKLAWVDGSLHRAGDLPRPQSLAELIGQQLRRLSAPALNLVRVAAVAGTAFSVRLAEHVLQRSALDLVDAWQELERGQVLRGTEFAHDLLQDAVLRSLPQPIAGHLHAEVAQSLEAEGAEPARIAAHWEAAGQVERALPALFNAAARAQAASRTPERIGFLLRAADIAESTGQFARAFDALQGAIEAHMNTLRDAKGFALLDRLAHLARTPEQRALAAGDRAWYHGIVGEWAEAVRAGQHALDLASGDVHPALRAVLQQRLGTSLGMLGQFDLALTHLRAAESGAPQYASPQEQAELQGHLAVLMGNLGQVAQAQAHHLREIDGPSTQTDHSRSATALANYASNRFQAGEVHEAWTQARLAQQRVVSGNLNGSSAGFVAVQVCQSARVLGRFREALAAGDQALALVQQSNPALLPPVRVARAQVWFDLGQFARVSQELHAIADWTQVAQRHQVRRLHLLARLAEAGQGAAGAEEAQRMWREAERSLPTTGWPELGFMLVLERCRTQPPAAALAALQQVLMRARESGMRGVELSAHVRLAETGLRMGGADANRRAADHARFALALSEQVCPTLVARAELWWQGGRALAAVGDPTAPATFESGVRWLNEAAAAQVDAPFRDSFLQRVAVHRALLMQRDMGSLVN